MNTKALTRITNPKPLPLGASGERIRATHAKAKTTAKLMAGIVASKQADTSPEMRRVLADLAGRQA